MSDKKNNNHKSFQIDGMHCKSCEILIEDALKGIDGVKKASADEKSGLAKISYMGNLSETQLFEKVKKAVEQVGYKLRDSSQGEGKLNFIVLDRKTGKELFIGLGLFLLLYFVFKNINIDGFSGAVSSFEGLTGVFLSGIIAGVSTCMALIGGLILGVSASYTKKHPEVTGFSKFTPHIIFNLGRILLFALFGGLIGVLGSFLEFSPNFFAFITLLSGIIMLILGLQIIGIFPWASKISITLPKGLFKFFRNNKFTSEVYSDLGAFVLGGLTFFVPCGFTQAAQLSAVSSGSFTTGALIMGIFALGTTPGLLGVGSLASYMKGFVSKFVGVTVLVLGVMNILGGFNLTSITTPFDSIKVNSYSQVSNEAVSVVNGIQTVRMGQDANGYSPSYVTIKKGLPTKWVINSTDTQTCASSLYSAELGIRQLLNYGENVIDFTPQSTGLVKFSCSMGMFVGYFNVVE